ncbi:MAG: Ti-type conjugative transfer relaxase TraA [Legionellaceae bacterium]|nr:Ti-type conjugative transfer relaxase TraA [Legionellaceae bacterium]
MAIAFAHVSIHTRAKGHSAIAASSYRTGSKLLDARTGITHDYSNRNDVVYTELLLPEDCDPAFENREFLWNQAELAEKRCDAQLCKDVVLALPKELDLTQQIELAKRFAQTHFVENGLAADIAIHDHGDGNPHAHILIPTRRLEKNRFSKYKARDLNPAFAKGHVIENDYWGERWREMQNDFFVEKNIDASVDLNHFISERHQGKIKGDSHHYLSDENKIIQQARQEFALSNIENIINHLSLEHSVFTRRDVEKLLFKTFKDSQKVEEYLQLVEQVMTHKTVIHLGQNDKGKECYTTRHQYIQEARLRSDIEKMMQRKNHVFTHNLENLSQRYTLSDEQQAALSYITQSADISVVVGRPGTGKSYLLKPVKEYYEANHCQVIGAALSGKVAKSLQTDTGITSSTIASLAYRLTHNQLKLSDKHVLIVDEAGMVDFANMAQLIHAAKKAGSKIVLVGDPDQLKPIFKGEIFKGIAAITGYIELENIKRQNDFGDRQASLHLAKGNIEEALHHYHEKGAVFLSSTSSNASDKLIDDWQQDLTLQTLKDTILLAFTRVAVMELNDKAREALKEKNCLGVEEVDFQGLDRVLKISVGERLLFRQNDKNIGLRNGDLGTVKAANKEQLQVELDSGEILNIPNTYQAMDYGYALTVHKSQGMTAEYVSVLIDSKYWDRHLSFVAMTRHKQSLKIYADTINHPSLGDLKRTLSRSVTKDNVIDWPLDFAIRAGFNPDKLIGKALNHLAGVGHKIKEGFNYVVNYEAYLLDAVQKSRYQDKVVCRSVAKQAADTMGSQHHKRIYEVLKTENPILTQYDALLKQRTHATGYYREKFDRQMHQTSKKLFEDKKLVEILKQFPPSFQKEISSRASDLMNDLGLEH